ncbi:DUF2318 domain-containing protein, partial [Candidatus Woesearchaeota archaeon]|nr:DUF2318 domain-containing protein [Candidatus Woesearchaeota archaeon]
EHEGTMIKYFAVRAQDGNIRTAFDACDVCGGHKGYRQNGNDVICNNCGRNFRIESIGEKNQGGGCWPSYLEHEIKNGNILIKKSDLESGRYMFS